MKIILLTGPARAGKGEVADYIYNLQKDSVVDKFAGPLKAMLYHGLGLTNSEVEGDMKEMPLEWAGGKTPRQLMQTLGTEWGRNIVDENFWVNYQTHKNIPELMMNGIELIVYDDTRFQNEINGIRSLYDTTVINISPGYKGYEPIEASGHASETQELEWDYQINNDGTIQELHIKTDQILGQIL